MEYQPGLPDSISIEDQAKDFSVYQLIQNYKEMPGVYLEQDLVQLENYIALTDDFKDYKEWLVATRNRNRIPIIDSMLTKQSIFIAVGAAHLTGEAGLLKLPEKKGYSIGEAEPEKISLSP